MSSEAPVLYDTHALLWYLAGDEQLPQRWRGAPEVASIGQKRFFSCASYWEIAIKINLEKLKLGRPFNSLAVAIGAQGFAWVPLTPAHCHEVVILPLRHRDPFDRLLVAQARVEGFTIVSADAQLRLYDVECVW